MTKYYVNKHPQNNGDHEVHTENCHYLPTPAHREDLGYYNSCAPAVAKAKLSYPKADGCFFCCRPCHTR